MFFEFLYLLVVALISLFGIHRIILLIEARSYSKQPLPPLVVEGEPFPRVLVQIPVYCDAQVALRCLRSLHDLDWPSRQLEIQVLDDSDDGSDQLIAAGVAEGRRLGLDIVHLQRQERTGFKAGALAAGLRQSTARFVAIFDADFTVPFDFLRRTIGAFDCSSVGMVQTRWGHRNREASLLTRAQARLLDGHFRLEHRARSAAGRFFNFNGTAGIWRRSTIDDCGGWSGDTVVEDMELSLRAWRRGWEFRYLDDIVCPADLPDNFGALRTQQRRWVAGAMQVLSHSFQDSRAGRSTVGLYERLDLLVILGGSLVAPLLLLLSFLLPCLWWQRLLWSAHPEYGELPLAGAESLDLIFFLAATVSIGLFYLGIDRKDLGSRIVELWGLMILGLGLCWHASQAVFDGLGGQVKIFERTPKSAQAVGSRPPTLAERVYFVYLVLAAVGACLGPGIASMPLLVMMALGLGWSLWPGSGARRVEKTDPAALDELAQLSLDP